MEVPQWALQFPVLDIALGTAAYYVFDLVTYIVMGAPSRERLLSSPRWTYASAVISQLAVFPLVSAWRIAAHGSFVTWLTLPADQASRLDVFPLLLSFAYLLKDTSYFYINAMLIVHHIVCGGALLTAAMGWLGWPPNLFMLGTVLLEWGSLVRNGVLLGPRSRFTASAWPMVLMTASNIGSFACCLLGVFLLLPPHPAGPLVTLISRYSLIVLMGALVYVRQGVCREDFGKRRVEALRHLKKQKDALVGR